MAAGGLPADGARAVPVEPGSVGRAPLGEPASATEWVSSELVVRLEHGGWSWAVATGAPLDEATARQVVEQVVERAD